MRTIHNRRLISNQFAVAIVSNLYTIHQSALVIFDHVRMETGRVSVTMRSALSIVMFAVQINLPNKSCFVL